MESLPAASTAFFAKMGLLRSEPMKHGTLVVPVERAREFIDLIGAELRNAVCSAPSCAFWCFTACLRSYKGKNTKMQFEDMNVRDMHRPYKKPLGTHLASEALGSSAFGLHGYHLQNSSSFEVHPAN